MGHCFVFSALDTVHCAIELQREVQGDPDLKLRIGIHLGDIVFKEGDIYGDGVNVASRIEQKEQGEVTVVPAKKRKSVFIIALWIIAGGIGFAAFMFAIFHFMEKGKKKQPFEQMEITRITTHGKAKDAVISPDGRYIVHVMEKDGLESLWLRQVATSSNVQILPPDKIRFQGLTFSGDGNYIFYISLDNSQSIPILYRMPVLGGSSVKILENVSGSIAFSPDNTRFAFIRLILSQGRQNFLLPT